MDLNKGKKPANMARQRLQEMFSFLPQHLAVADSKVER
jgi:hypothetical protein